MKVLDTNHLAELERDSPAGRRLRERLAGEAGEVSITIVTVEEHLRGWLALIHRATEPSREVAVYARLQSQVAIFARWRVLPYDASAADCFLRLRGLRLGIGSMDLKIACISLVHDATLLTRNTVDFAKVPGLSIENWLD